MPQAIPPPDPRQASGIRGKPAPKFWKRWLKERGDGITKNSRSRKRYVTLRPVRMVIRSRGGGSWFGKKGAVGGGGTAHRMEENYWIKESYINLYKKAWGHNTGIRVFQTPFFDPRTERYQGRRSRHRNRHLGHRTVQTMRKEKGNEGPRYRTERPNAPELEPAFIRTRDESSFPTRGKREGEPAKKEWDGINIKGNDRKTKAFLPPAKGRGGKNSIGRKRNRTEQGKKSSGNDAYLRHKTEEEGGESDEPDFGHCSIVKHPERWEA